MEESAKSPLAPKTRRWWKRAVAALILVAAAIVAALPWALNTEKARNWLLDRANESLSPGRLEVARFGFSWFRPTRLDGFVLRDPQGDAVLASDRAVWDRNLFQVLFQRPKYGTLRLNKGVVDVERAEDGSIDVIEALRPILKGTPPTDWTIRVVEGSLRLRSPELAKPIEAGKFDLTIRRPASPGEVTWRAALGDEAGRTLAVTGGFARWDGKPEGEHGLALDFQAGNWPLAVAANGLSGTAALDGRIAARRTDGRWTTEGDARLIGLDLGGPALSGDRVRLASLGGTWSLGRTDRGWAVQGLDLRSPIGTLTVSGPVPAPVDGTSRLVGSLDLAALAGQMPRTLHLRQGLSLDRGRAELAIAVETRPDRRLWTAVARIADLSAHLGETAVSLREPATLSAKVRERDGNVVVEGLALESAFLKAEGKGDLEAGVSVSGSIDLAALFRQAADFVDLGRLGIAGSGPFTAGLKRESGDLVGRFETTFQAASLGPEGDALQLQGLAVRASARGPRTASLADWRVDAELAVSSAKRAGLALGPTRIAAHREAGAFGLEPIETTLNGGRLRLVPELVTEPELMLKLGSGSELVDAEVNEEATRRVLAFVAPVLDGATRARGRVSAAIERAEFPLGANARTRAVVEGKVVFQDLVFAPGPFASVVLDLMGRSDATLRLDQPVVLSISDGMVHQRGLEVPVGNLTRIAIEGSVGFDRSLDLRTTIPITPAMFPNNPALADVVGGSRITVPIRGTLDKPQIDKDAFRAGLADVGKGLLLRGAARGAAGMLFRLSRPRNPDAPPPPTAEERRAKRLERRMQRRGAD